MASHQLLLYHIVFSVKHRKPLLRDDQLRNHTWSYMAGIVKKNHGFAFNINGYFDHAHLLVNIPAKVAVSDFVRSIKANSSKHINESSQLTCQFAWQSGYGAFTVSHSNKQQVSQYIDDQIAHHSKLTFKEELLLMLKKHQIEYDPAYIWE